VRSYVPDFDLRTPASLAEALGWLAAEPGRWTPLAGGTDLMVLFEAGQLAARRLVNIWGLPELCGIRVTDAYVELGALTTYREIQAHDVLRREFPALCQAGAETGGLAIQNRGTIGGNVANASPAADSPPVLLVHDAAVELVSTRGARWTPYEGFHTGYKRVAMQPDEMIRALRLPRIVAPEGGAQRHYYRKVGTRKAQAISKVVLAGLAQMQGGKLTSVRLAVGSVGPTTMRCPRTEALLVGTSATPTDGLIAQARAEIEREVQPIDDIRSTAAFRAHVTGNLLQQFLERLGAPHG
jgi:CO/xanthine dehydrogenase FAD-binding subunit